MRIAVLAVTIAVTAAPAAPPGVYHADPNHLWNRLHDALFCPRGRQRPGIRTRPVRAAALARLAAPPRRRFASAASFGAGRVQSRRRRARAGSARARDAPARSVARLQLAGTQPRRFLRFPGNEGVPGAARQEALRRPLARAIGAPRAHAAADRGACPTHYAAAVASHEFADRLRSAPTRTVPISRRISSRPTGRGSCLGRGDDLIAPSHVLSDNPFTTSAFLIFIKLPGGRAATRAYVERLGAFTGPRVRRAPPSRRHRSFPTTTRPSRSFRRAPKSRSCGARCS